MSLNIKILASSLVISSLFLQSSLITNADGRTINFSGYNWNVKSGNMGPGPNWWTDQTGDVYTDSSGALHLSVINRNGTWYSSEVYLPSSLGYGKYSFVTNSNVDSLDPNVVLGLFMYQDDTHEIDTEYSKWGIPTGPNLGYSVQPAGTKGNNYQFTATLNHNLPVTNEIDWQPNSIIFRAIQNGNILKEWTYTGTNNFVPGKEFADMNFWMMSGLAPTDGHNVEAVINDFKFTPYTAPIINPQPAPQPVITPISTTPAPTTQKVSPIKKNTSIKKIFKPAKKPVIKKPVIKKKK